jgi:hypothetical protein
LTGDFSYLTTLSSHTTLLTNKIQKGQNRVSALGFNTIIPILIILLGVIIIIREPTGWTPAAG